MNPYFAILPAVSPRVAGTAVAALRGTIAAVADRTRPARDQSGARSRFWLPDGRGGRLPGPQAATAAFPTSQARLRFATAAVRTHCTRVHGQR